MQNGQYSKKFREEHEEEILLHQAAKNAFDEMGVKKLPIIKQGDDRLYSFKIEPTTGVSFFRMLTEDLRLNTGLLDTFLPLIKAH